MQCEYCGKQAYVTHICPYCKEHYCLKHREPEAHDCSSHKRPIESDSKPRVFKPQLPEAKILQKPAIRLPLLKDAQKKLFAASFTLVLTEEILRLISYVKNPPFLAYLDGNIYVEILYQHINPYIASLIIFILACLILFGTRKLSSKNRSSSNPYTKLLQQVVPLCIFAAITITYLFSTVNWLFILTS